MTFTFRLTVRGRTVKAPIVLPTVPVEGKADSYRTEESLLARVATPLVDTPQTDAVVPERVMDEQRGTMVREALRTVSGITTSAGEGGRGASVSATAASDTPR